MTMTTTVMGLSLFLKKLASGGYPTGDTINLRNCRMDAHCAEAIAKALISEQCSSNIKLLFYGNWFCDAGAEAFANAIVSGKCPIGLTLDLSANNITDIGAKAILKAIESENCSEGLCIDLRGNNIDPILLKKITSKLEKNNRIAEEKKKILFEEQLGDIVRKTLTDNLPQLVVRIIFDYLLSSENSLILADKLFGTTIKQSISDGKGLAKLGVFPDPSKNVKLTKEQWLTILTRNLEMQFHGIEKISANNEKIRIEFINSAAACHFSDFILKEAKILTEIKDNCLLMAGKQIGTFVERFGKIDPLLLFSEKMLETKEEVPARSCALM